MANNEELGRAAELRRADAVIPSGDRRDVSYLTSLDETRRRAAESFREKVGSIGAQTHATAVVEAKIGALAKETTIATTAQRQAQTALAKVSDAERDAEKQLQSQPRDPQLKSEQTGVLVAAIAEAAARQRIDKSDELQKAGAKIEQEIAFRRLETALGKRDPENLRPDPAQAPAGQRLLAEIRSTDRTTTDKTRESPER